MTNLLLSLRTTCLVFSITLIFSASCAAGKADFSLDLQNTSLADAIRSVAAFLDMNVIISPATQGLVTMRVRDAAPAQVLDMLLVSHGLARWQSGNIWFIAPQQELIKRKQDEKKWHEAAEDAAPLITQTWKIRYAKADDIARLLQDGRTSLISRRGHVKVDTRTNMLCIQELAEHIEAIHQWVVKLDVPVKQIVISARLLSVDSNFERELGLDFSVRRPWLDTANGEGSKSLGARAGHYSLAIAELADGSLLDVKLSALEDAGHAELISSPRLFTANQQSASIEAGEEVPYQEVSESGGTAMVFKKAVLGLKVTPQILPGHKVLLHLQINQDRPSTKVVLGVPTISTRQMRTSVLVSSGRTIVLGGIYETSAERGEQGLPFLGHVPVLGWLFKQQSTRESKRELLIFVTPTIIEE